MKASEIAQYVIAYNDKCGDLITNKKLQKLLYYIAAWGLVYFDEGIIDDDFVAWSQGPVCICVYEEYKKFKYSPVKIDYKTTHSASEYLKLFLEKHQDVKEISDKIELINNVLQKYISFSSLQLELLSHSEEPWKEARKGLSPIDKGNNVIKKETISKYFKSLIDAD